MIDRRTATLSSAIVIAVFVAVFLTFILHTVFDLGPASLISFPLSFVGTMLTVQQYLEKPVEGTKFQVFQHKNVTTQTMPEKSEGGRNWSEMTDKEITEEMRSSPDWRSYQDNAFRNYRSVGRGFNWLSSVALKSQYVTRQRIMLLLFGISTIGGMWLFLIFAEVIGTNTDIQETDNGREVNGQRILRCESCNNLELEETNWLLQN